MTSGTPGSTSGTAPNIQVLTDPTGYPVWVSDVEPGSTHDLTAARAHAFPALYPAAAQGLPTLTDKGYAGAGIGIIVPTKGDNLHPDHRARNAMINALRAPAERANALLKRTWRALERVTLDPGRIGAITAAALVLPPPPAPNPVRKPHYSRIRFRRLLPEAGE
jgi:hypothetical protein